MNIKIDSFFRNSQGEADVNYSVDGKFNQVKAYREFGKWRVYDHDTAQRDLDVKIQKALNELIAYRGEDEPEVDNVNKPSHYQLLPGVEVKQVRDAILAKIPAGVNYSAIDEWSRAWEYLTRMWGKNGLEDAKKAQVYLGWLIERLESGK